LEFYSTKFNELCRDKGLARQNIACYIPHQNGVAERMNMTFLEKAICMLSNLGLNKSFWVEAVNTTCHLVNYSSSIAIDFKTPIEVWSNKIVGFTIL